MPTTEREEKGFFQEGLFQGRFVSGRFASGRFIFQGGFVSGRPFFRGGFFSGRYEKIKRRKIQNLQNSKIFPTFKELGLHFNFGAEERENKGENIR